MATASRRITRKQLRQPDWLHTTTEQALELYEGNRVVVLTGAVVLILLLLGVWALQAFKQNQDNQAAQEFSRAINLYQTEKYREAVAALQKAGAYRERAIMGKGRCSEQIGDTKSALAAYKEYLQDNPDSPLAIHIAELEAKTGRQAAGK